MLFFLVILVISGCVQAQYEQRWTWMIPPLVGPNQAPAPPAASWRPTPNSPYLPVIFPGGNVILQYNCAKMPAICQNVADWHANPATSIWPGRWANWFTYDLGHTTRSRGKGRRDHMCPRTWKGTVANPRCPEPNQPRVVPPLYDEFTRQPVTALAPQMNPLSVSLRIADGRDDPLIGQNQPSGRGYSCDEFPPASWIEGGDGVNRQSAGTTYCAPIAMPCGNAFNARGSEQNWQGSVHGYLGGHLEVEARALGPYNDDMPIAFQFVRVNSPLDIWAARVEFDDSGFPGGRGWDPVHPGTTFVRRADEKVERHATQFVPTGNGSLAIVLSNGEVFHGHEPTALQRAVKRSEELIRGGLRKRSTSTATEEVQPEISNSTDVPKWHITAEDVDPSLTTYGLETQQNPVDAIDIIELSKQYILGQIGSHNTTNGTLINNTASPSHRHSRHAKKHMSPHNIALQKRVDGPVQCGPGQPCLDGSCCNKEGKCGYKADQSDGKTPCGLKLCCSFYGWCGTEDVHCKDPEPTVGKTPCQQGFGSCEIKPSPSCGKGSGTSKRRRIAYYQGCTEVNNQIK
ncbi:hypothetical protein EJ02DRAFT_511607 [Clathrospora elynae]|uniref:Chitin-binding type-1 domain-containing protein n=1 Tax=Clathrospora elynae TaxID=706981 RepID=A0A6A5SST9_9PLEO|nr:hypothetical protein EJ02DRAFT_511607 [Clathrospora elynae]